VHRTAAFQYQLGAGIPLQKTKWLGTHNSFNSVNDSPTPSHTDSNQQLSLTQQLDVDTPVEDVTDADIERAIAEIQDAIRKVPR